MDEIGLTPSWAWRGGVGREWGRAGWGLEGRDGVTLRSSVMASPLKGLGGEGGPVN